MDGDLGCEQGVLVKPEIVQVLTKQLGLNLPLDLCSEPPWRLPHFHYDPFELRRRKCQSWWRCYPLGWTSPSDCQNKYNKNGIVGSRLEPDFQSNILSSTDFLMKVTTNKHSNTDNAYADYEVGLCSTIWVLLVTLSRFSPNCFLDDKYLGSTEKKNVYNRTFHVMQCT